MTKLIGWLPLTFMLLPAAAETPTTCSAGAGKIAPGVLLMQLKRFGLAKHAPIALNQDYQDSALEEALGNLQAEMDLLQSEITEVTLSVTGMVGTCCNSCENGTVASHTVETTTDTTTTTTQYLPNLCAIFGDPHFITFDGAQTTFVGGATLWVVKSGDGSVSMQAISMDSDGKFTALAIGGSFLSGHVLIVHNPMDGGPLQALLDGVPILNETTSEFHEAGVLDAYRSASWDSSRFNNEVLNVTTQMPFEIGPWASRFERNDTGGLYMFSLPNRIQVTVSGVDWMSAVVSMVAIPAGQSGYCGNFNGNPDDDAEPVVPSWNRPIGDNLQAITNESESLFAGYSAERIPALLMISNVVGPYSKDSLLVKETALTQCDPALKEQATFKCGNLVSRAFQTSCMFDVCTSGQLSAADDDVAAEVLEHHVNARGVPRFVGHGECLDSQDRRFKSFNTNLRTDEECQDVLRHLSSVRGVIGAQLHRAHGCQVLVNKDVDPTIVMIPRGWTADGGHPHSDDDDTVGISSNGFGKPLFTVGHGEISHTTDDGGWNCWHLN